MGGAGMQQQQGVELRFEHWSRKGQAGGRLGTGCRVWSGSNVVASFEGREENDGGYAAWSAAYAFAREYRAGGARRERAVGSDRG